MKRVITESAFRANASFQQFKTKDLPSWFYKIVGKTKEELRKANWDANGTWFECVEEEPKGEY